MKTFRTFAIAAFATMLLATATAPAGSSASAALGCGPTLDIRDPGLRASFARFDKSQSATAGKICAAYRNDLNASFSNWN